jgi:hypothetical protein
VGHTETVSTEDQTLTAALHGEALLTARRPELGLERRRGTDVPYESL